MKKLAVFAVAAVFAACAFAQNAEWIGNSYVTVGDTFYGGSAQHENGPFNGLDLGTISSVLLGGQIQSYGDQDGANNPAFLNYSIDNGAASQIELAWFQYEQNNNWFQGQQSVDTSSYADGESHNLKVYFSKPSGNPAAYEGNLYETNENHDYVATFKGAQAVPEPATMSLLGLGALAMALRRKLRK